MASIYAFATAFIAVSASAHPLAAEQCAESGQLEITGVVIDELTQRRLPGAQVRLIAAQGRQDARTTLTDREGLFRICVAPAALPTLLYGAVGERVTNGIVLRDAQAAAEPIRLALMMGSAIQLAGRVYDQQNGRGIARAEVTIAQYFVQVTDRNGRFAFAALPGGDYVLRAEHLGFQRSSETLRLVPGVNLDVAIPLTVEAIELPSIVVTARSKGLEQAGFYQRREAGQGAFLTRTEIDKMRGIALPSDLLRGFNGVFLARRPNGRGHRIVGRNQCPYRYYVDGVRIGPQFDFDDLEWHWIDAVEVYNGLGQIPARFADADPMYVRSCGVVVVWTRQVAR